MPTTATPSSKGHPLPPLFALIFYPASFNAPPLPSKFIHLPDPLSVMSPTQYEEHANHIKSLRASRVLLQGGPYRDTKHSVPVIQATDRAAAEQVAAANPAVAAGVLKVAVVPWNVVFGIHRGI